MLEAHRDVIIKAFNNIGVKVNRLAKSKLNDGWFIYHDYAPVSANVQYKYTVISKSDTQTIKRRERQYIKVDFISDCGENDFNASLSRNIAEAKHRMA